MASKALVFVFLCVALVAVVQSAPQYAPGEDPTYDEDDFEVAPLRTQPASSNEDQAASEDDFDPSLLVEEYANSPSSRDPGRSPEFLKNVSSNNDGQSSADSGSSSESDE